MMRVRAIGHGNAVVAIEPAVPAVRLERPGLPGITCEQLVDGDLGPPAVHDEAQAQGSVGFLAAKLDLDVDAIVRRGGEGNLGGVPAMPLPAAMI